ncbi:membrane protein [Formosimonas limnophila]|uniref:Membrane protein n=1 Tax=Formosimonas limnophila TaxID=1384487 RepID=A0A8J3CN25_9BURK|nr:DoxX family protein [Formosimonas limnophila]GHA73544.1 membrane protein [Formosimonas limnophila]
MKTNRVLSRLMWHGNDDVVSKSLADLLLLALRWFIAWQFLKAGLVKLDDWSSTLALFESEYQVPLLSPVLAAYFGTAGELVFPILLMAGLFTRWAALGLFAVNAMAVISYPQLFTFNCPAAINDHKYWAVILAVIFVFGAGRLSVDALFGRKTA